MKARTSIASIVLLMTLATLAQAKTGAVVQLSGTLSVQKPNGAVRILSMKSEIQVGDTLITQRDSYARVRFADGGQITLKPNTSLKIDQFSFVKDDASRDSLRLTLLKGGVRAATGLVGKRGSAGDYRLATTRGTLSLPGAGASPGGCPGGNCEAPSDAIVVTAADSDLTIRGASFAVEDCVTSRCDRLPGAVFVSVVHGEVLATNESGFERFLAGEFGALEGNDRAPRFLTTDPGLQFTPPASFIQSISGGTAVNTGRNQECVVKR